MKLKIKNWFEKNKDKIFIWICVGLIAFVVFLIVLFKNSDENNLKNNKADICLIDDNIDLKKNFIINDDGNLVGNNLVSEFRLLPWRLYAAVSLKPNTTYSFSCIKVSPPNNVYAVRCALAPSGDVVAEDNIVYTFWQDNYSYSITDFSFTTPSIINGDYWLVIGASNQTNDITNIMLNEGSIALPWEPYGVWYSQGNYNNYGDVKFDDGYDDGYGVALSDVYSNNPFYNATLKYYATLDANNYWFTTTIGNSLLQNSNTLDVNQVVKSVLNENDQQSYYDDQGIGYFKIDFVKTFSASEMVYLVNAQSPYQFDHYFTYYFDDGSQWIFHNTLTTNYSEYYYQYDVNLSNTDKNGKRVVGISFRKGGRDIVNSVSQSQYNIGFNDGYSNGYDSGYDSGLSSGYNNGYNVGKADGYGSGFNDGANQEITTNGFKILFNSILSYPINFISTVFNFEFMGINVASVVLFLVSIGVVLFVIKRLWK